MHSGQTRQRGAVALQDGLELDALAHRHDGDAVVADRAGNQDAVAGPGDADRQRSALRHQADAGSGDEDLVALAPVHDLGVAGDQGHARLVAGLPHRGDDALQVGQRQALLEDEGGREEQRLGAADRQVVHGAVDRQPADVAAREEQRADHEGIGGEGHRGDP